MATFQDQLQEYRNKKRRREAFESFKAKCRKFLMLGTGKYNSNPTVIEIKEKDCVINSNDHDDDINNLSTLEEEDQLLVNDDIKSNDEETQEEEDPRKQSKCLKYTLWTVYFLFWTTLYIIAIELKFGVVFLMFSALFGIYFNTRTGPKVHNEISAYSVFNKNFESIDGTLKAEQFEREIRYGAGSVR